MSERGALLLPNLGGEETNDWRAAHRQPAVAASARLWRLLFSRDASLLAGDREPGDRRDDPWPEALGPPPTGPVFAWLENAGGAVPWYPASELQRDPALAGRRIAAADPECVARVHDKAFAHAYASEQGFLPRGLRDLVSVLDPEALRHPEPVLEEIRQRIHSWPAWTGGRYTLKPRFGSSGRGRLGGVGAESVSETLRGGLARLAARGGALLEPWLTRTADFSTQLYVGPDAGVLLLGSLEQVLTASGLYRGHRGEIDSRGRVFSGHEHEEALREAAAGLANAAAAEGFYGPCGVDAFEYSAEDARPTLRPIVEFNARFTMGTVVVGLIRHVLEAAKRAIHLEPGERRSFYFSLDAPAPAGWEPVATRAGLDSHFVPLWRERDAMRPALLFAANRAAIDAALEAA